MKIYVDADACPTAIKEILLRASERKKIQINFVANTMLKLPLSKLVTMTVVEEGPDIADDRIAEMAEAGDLVITEDVPLADRVVTKGATVFTTRGDVFNSDNIKGRLATRDLLSELRDGGMETGGPPPLDQRAIRSFANQIDIFLTKNCS
jgi:uncharacterized protein YaiI (UPF0178 family)